MLDWKRPRNESTEIATFKVFESRCKEYQVVHSHITAGEGPSGYTDRWVALTRGRKKIISSHRKKEAAIKACEAYHKARGGS